MRKKAKAKGPATATAAVATKTKRKKAEKSIMKASNAGGKARTSDVKEKKPQWTAQADMSWVPPKPVLARGGRETGVKVEVSSI